MSESIVSLSRAVACQSPPAKLWSILADTDRLNRAVGLSRITARPLADAGAARFLVATKLGGFQVEYEERPVEFVEHERFGFVRAMRRGPVRLIEVGFELQPRGAGTDVFLSLRIVPRWSVLAPLARWNGWLSLRKMAGQVRRLDGEAIRGRAIDRGVSPADATALGRASEGLRSAVSWDRRAFAEKLIEHVRGGPDAAVARIRPLELAEAWRAPPRDVVAVCLQAVIAGLLELSWDLVCPSCRTAAEQTRSLADLRQAGHCQLCDLSFGIDLDKAVEATFRPPASIRAIDEGPYCIGGPARTPHVVAQAMLPARSSAELRVPKQTGRLRLFVRGGATASVDVHGDAPPVVNVEAGEQIRPAALSVRPGGTVAVKSALSGDVHVKLERSEWINRAATAAFISTIPEFRRLFSGEVLAPGLALKVGRIALLFTDLAGSTALYARAGDAAAFRLVRDSFDLFRTAVEQNGGTVVKTIGDAVMAAFSSEEGAVRASVAMQRGFPDFVRRYEYAGDVDLKLGVYSGPCFAVTANGVLDYFGQTVNVAARLQSQAEPGDLILPEELADASSAAGWLAGSCVVDRYSTALKGVHGAIRLARIRAEGLAPQRLPA